MMLRKIGLLSCLIILLLNPLKCFGTTVWTSHYPPAQNDTYVKAGFIEAGYEAYKATDPTTSLTGPNSGNAWGGTYGSLNNRFHIDLGTPIKISRFMYVNASGGASNDSNMTGLGVKYFTLWGSNTAQAFNDLTWGNDTYWIPLTTSTNTLERHTTGTTSPDLRYITVIDADAYRYYAFKFSDNWYSTNYQVIRRLELQSNDGSDGYDSVYPPAFSSVYVRATSYGSGPEDPVYNSSPYIATDPSVRLNGYFYPFSWESKWPTNSNQRFHIDLGTAKAVARIYYENSHSRGSQLTGGVKDYTLWGSNSDASFADTVYANDTGWTQITGVSQSSFDQHSALDLPDPKYITVANTTPYRYYAFKFANNYGNSSGMSLRHIELQVAGTPAYITVFPPAQNDTYVKATSYLDSRFYPFLATDPTIPLSGGYFGTSWRANQVWINQRFNMDLGSAQIIKRIYYENQHYEGTTTDQGVFHFTFYGSNTASAFAATGWYDNADWTQLTTLQSTMDQHNSFNGSDPKYIGVTNTTAYRYYSFKFADAHGGAAMGVRRIELQKDNIVEPPPPTSTLTLKYSKKKKGISFMF